MLVSFGLSPTSVSSSAGGGDSRAASIPELRAEARRVLNALDTPERFAAAGSDIRDLIEALAPYLPQFHPGELRQLAAGPFMPRRGAPSAPMRMRYFIEAGLAEREAAAALRHGA